MDFKFRMDGPFIECISGIRIADRDYQYDPEHKDKPQGGGWRETDRGWTKKTYNEQIGDLDIKDKYIFPHNAVFSFSSDINVKFHGTSEEQKSFPERFKRALANFISKKNEYKAFQEKYSSVLNKVVEKTKGSGNELIIYGWSVRKGKTNGKFDVEMLGVDPTHTLMIGQEIAKEFGRVEIATDTPDIDSESIVIDNYGNISPYYGLPEVKDGKTRFTFSTNVTIDLDNNTPKNFIEGLKKALKNYIIKTRNSVLTKQNEIKFHKKIKKAFEDNGFKFDPLQISISPVYGGYQDWITHHVGTEISYDVHFKQIDPDKAVSIARALNKELRQQSTLLTAYGPEKRASLYIS